VTAARSPGNLSANSAHATTPDPARIDLEYLIQHLREILTERQDTIKVQSFRLTTGPNFPRKSRTLQMIQTLWMVATKPKVEPAQPSRFPPFIIPAQIYLGRVRLFAEHLKKELH